MRGGKLLPLRTARAIRVHPFLGGLSPTKGWQLQSAVGGDASLCALMALREGK